MSQSLGTLKAYIGLDTKQLESGAARSKAVLGGLTGTATKLMGAIGVTLGTAAAFAGLKKVAEQGKEFEGALRKAGLQMRATSSDMAILRKAALDMGSSTEFGAVAAAKGLEQLGQDGVKAATAIKLLPVAMRYATAHAEELSAALEVAHKGQEIWGLSIAGTARYLDVMTKAAVDSSATISDMEESMRMVGPSAKAIGYTYEETAGYLMALSEAGLSGSRVAQALAMAMRRAGSAAKSYGYGSAKLSDILKNLNRDGRDVWAVLEGFGARSGVAAMALKSMTGEADAFTKSLADSAGETERLANSMSQSLGYAMKELKAAGSGISVEAFQNFKTDLLSMVKALTRFVREHKQALVDLISALAKAVGIALKVLGEIGAVAVIITEDITSFFRSSVSGAKEAVEAAKQYAKELDKIKDLTSPETWRVEALKIPPPKMDAWSAALIELRRNWDGVWNNIKDTARMGVAAVIGTVTRTITIISRLVTSAEHLSEYIFTAIGALQALAKGDTVSAGIFAKEGWTALKKTVSDASDAMGTLNDEWLALNYGMGSGPEGALGKRLFDEQKSRKDGRTTAQVFSDGFYSKLEDEYHKLGGVGSLFHADPAVLKKAAQQAVSLYEMYMDSSMKGSPLGPIDLLPTPASGPEQWAAGGRATGAGPSEDEIDAPMAKAADRLAATAQLYKDMLATGGQTLTELTRHWESYEKAQSKLIRAQAKDYVQQQGNTELARTRAKAWTKDKLAGLAAERREFFANNALLEAQVNIYGSMLQSGRLTAQGLEVVWAKYEKARRAQNDLTMQKLKETPGVTPDEVVAQQKENERALTDEHDRYLSAIRTMETDTLLQMVSTNKLSARETLKVWTDYYKKRMELFQINAKPLIETGAVRNTGDLVRMYQEERRKARKEFGQASEDRIATEADTLKSILDANVLSRREQFYVWEKYARDRKKLIESTAREIARLSGQGDADLYKKAELGKLERERLELLGTEMEKFWADIGKTSGEGFSEAFYAVMSGNWEDLHDWWKSLMDSIMRSASTDLGNFTKDIIDRIGGGKLFGSKKEGGEVSVLEDPMKTLGNESVQTSVKVATLGESAQQAAIALQQISGQGAGGGIGDLLSSLGGIFGGMGEGGGWAGESGAGSGYTDWTKPTEYPMAAAGGIVKSRTTLVAGESGPEAIVPLSKMRDASFWKGLEASGTSGKQGRQVVVHMNVQATDAASFQKSQSQIMSKLSVAMDQSRRRD